MVKLKILRKYIAALFGFVCICGFVKGQGTQPIVAIHDSELTRALETMPASGATPTGTGYTGNQWFVSQWHYFVMPDAVKEALRSDGTAFTVVGDSNILAGVLTNADGSPKFPILISLASEAIDDGEIAALTNYVAAGGFLFVGSSSFTRNTNGTARGDFAIANAMGIHMATSNLNNWRFDNTFTVFNAHRLVTNIPTGTLQWQMPSSSEEISWPVAAHLSNLTPNLIAPGLPHLIWQVQSSNATLIAYADAGFPYLMAQSYGRGCFIYEAAMQPLIGHSGWSPGTAAYSIFRNAILWAFESAGLPVVKNSPWPYPYDAAVMFRHDMEAIPANIIGIQNSAHFEFTNGAFGDYYFCTGTLREDMPGVSNAVIASLQMAVSNYGATISAHNGGLTNVNPIYSPMLAPVEPNVSTLLGEGWLTAFEPYTDPVLFPLNTNGFDYDYWHWGPDEILGVTNLLGGFTNATDYVFMSLSNSFNDIAAWQLTNGGPREWVAPYFTATREASYQIEEGLGIKVTGDDKLTPFPHWVFSTQTPDRYYSILSEPVSDIFINNQVAQSMENHSQSSIQALVDFYYNLGGLINLYTHSASDGSGVDGTLPVFYTTYSVSKPRIWSANATRIYNWWSQRSNALMTVSFYTNGIQSVTTIGISGNSNTNAAVEFVVPGSVYSLLQISTNGVSAGTNVYRVNGKTVKVLVGNSVSNVVAGYILGSVAVPAPVILSIGLTNQTITVTWSSITGATYGLQSTTNLAGAVWNNVLPNVTATGTTASQTNFIGDATQQFYRVAAFQSP